MAVAKKTTPPATGNGKSPPQIATFSKEQELEALRMMLLIRRFEEKAGQLYGMGAIGGFCHLYIGQEAVVVGMQMTLKLGDQVITGYRDHGHMLACGMDPKGVMAELTGRRHGYSKGKGGSMHMFSTEKHFYGGHGIVGAQVSARHGTGLRQPLPRERQCEPGLFRRRRRQPGAGLRKLQHGRAVEAAGHLHRREQPLRHGHVGQPLLGAAGFFQTRRVVRYPRRTGGRHGRARGEGCGRESRAVVPRGQRALHP